MDPLENDSFDGQSCTLEMTALTAKAAWGVLKRWRGSPGSLRNDSFDGQSCLRGFEALAGQSWIP